jgi:hypothetical protein
MEQEINEINKKGKELRAMITKFLMEKFEEVIECFEELKPREKVKVFCDMLSFAVPKLKAVSDDIFDYLGGSDIDALFERLKESQQNPPPIVGTR